MNNLEQAIDGYWQAPDAEAFVALFVSTGGGGDWRPEAVLTVPVFLAHVLDANQDLAETVVDKLRGGDPVKVEIVAQALNYSHVPARVRLMERLVGERAAAGMDLDGADFTTFQPSHPVHVDMLWASFLATGDTVYVERVAALLEGWLPEAQLQGLLARAAAEPAVQEQALTALLAKAAQVTLQVRAGTCEPVRQTLARRAAAMDGVGAAVAARILAGLQRSGAA